MKTPAQIGRMGYGLFTASILTVAWLAVSSCASPLSGERGALDVRWLTGAMASRTVFPFDPSLAATNHYDVVLTGPNEATETLSGIVGTTAERAWLAVGTWNVEVVAFNAASQVLGRGSASAEVRSDAVTSVQIDVKPSGEGSLAFTVSWDGNALVEPSMALEASLLAQGETVYMPLSLTAETAGASFSGTHLSGAYRLLLKLKNATGGVLWGVVETFHLYEGLTSSKSFTVLPGDMNAAPESAPVFQSVDRSYDKIRFTWSDASARTEKYRLERKNVVGDWTFLADIPYTTLEYTDSGLTAAVSYTYRLRSENTFGVGAWAADLTVTTMPLQTVSGLMIKSEVWTSDKVYRVTNSLKIPEGLTLTVMPGTKVIIDAEKYIQVEGTLVARGLAESPIIFGYDSSGWAGIRFTTTASDAVLVNGHYSSGTVMERVLVRGGGKLSFDSVYPYLDYLNIDGSSASGLIVSMDGDFSNRFSLTNSAIRNSASWAIELAGSGNAAIKGNYFFGANGIYLGGGDRHGSIISNNRMEVWGTGFHTSDCNLSATETEPWIVSNNSIIWSTVSGTGMYFQYGYLSNGRFEGNEIINKDGFSLYQIYSMGAITITSNIMKGGSYAVSINAPSWCGMAMSFIGNCFIDNTGVGLHCNYAGSNNIQFIGNYFDNPAAPYEVTLGGELYRSGQEVLSLANNYWTSTNAETVKLRILDSDDNFEMGKVTVEPVGVLNGIQVKLVYPADGASLPDSAVPFSWMALGRPASSELQLARDVNFTDLVTTVTEIAGGSWTLGKDGEVAGIAAGTTYYWRAAARDAGGTLHPYATGRSFSIALAVPLTTAPLDGEIIYDDLRPTLRWIPSSGAVKYHLRVANNPAFSPVFVDTATLAVQEYEFPSDLSPGTTYYWQVAGIDANGLEGAMSALQAFNLPPAGIYVRVDPDLPGPQSLAIAGAATAVWGTNVVFTASSADTMDRYVWTLNGEKIAESFMPTFTLNPSVYTAGFYTIGVTAWKGSYSYSAYRPLRISRTDGGSQP